MRDTSEMRENVCVTLLKCVIMFELRDTSEMRENVCVTLLKCVRMLCLQMCCPKRVTSLGAELGADSTFLLDIVSVIQPKSVRMFCPKDQL